MYMILINPDNRWSFTVHLCFTHLPACCSSSCSLVLPAELMGWLQLHYSFYYTLLKDIWPHKVDLNTSIIYFHHLCVYHCVSIIPVGHWCQTEKSAAGFEIVLPPVVITLARYMIVHLSSRLLLSKFIPWDQSGVTYSKTKCTCHCRGYASTSPTLLIFPAAII